MKRLTVDDVMAMDLGDDCPRERVAGLWAGRDALTAREIGELDIPDDERVWVLAQMLSAREARLLACDFVEASLALHWKSDDRGPHEALRVARLFALGDATAVDLRRASSSAFRAWMAEKCAKAETAAWLAWVVCGEYVSDVAMAAAEYAWDSDRESLYARIEESAE